jgi:ADP-ribose/FAD diphosphatase
MTTRRFCNRCGAVMAVAVPAGDNRERHLCDACGHIDYQNPRVVVGAVVEHAGGVLLCRRAIDPRRGFWTVPAGFLELGESAADGAVRETFEETGVTVRVEAPLVHFDLPAIGQIYLLFRATAADLAGLGHPDTWSESLEVRSFGWDEIPWPELAFDAVRLTLELRIQDLRAGVDQLHHGAVTRRPDATSTLSLHAHTLVGHTAHRLG